MSMNYRVSVAEQMFLLGSIADLGKLAGTPTFTNLDLQLVSPILTAAAELAEGSYSPLSRAGDRVGARWNEGSVTMPLGYRAAYQAYVDGGWGSLGIHSDQGGQGLPFVLATAIQEALGTADLAFALVHMLTQCAAATLLAHGSDNPKAKWLDEAVRGLSLQPDGSELHSRLVEQYRRRAELTADLASDREVHAARRADHHAAVLQAVHAGRTELLRLHRKGDLPDDVVRDIELELDLQQVTSENWLSTGQSRSG